MATIPMPNPTSKIIEEPPVGSLPMQGASPWSVGGSIGSLVISVASAADMFTRWGVHPRERDGQLRAFWPTEETFASALFSAISQYVAFGYSLIGPDRTKVHAEDMMNGVQMGQGWEAMMTPWLVDYFTQDNGAFLEVVRTDDDPRAPVVTLNHLDAARCIRTGRHEHPVVYFDMRGRYHELPYYNVVATSEMPSPIEEARGLQYSLLTRVLRACQTMRDISVVQHEKASGRFTRQVHLVSGVQTQLITDAMEEKQAQADQMGLVRYVAPLILGSLDPTARVSKETIDLASIPQDFDPQKQQQAYITLLSMGFGIDYQSFAPLPGGGLGSGSQSKILNMKSRGKGPLLFMHKIQRLFNFHGLLPRSIKFEFGEQDAAEQMERAELKKTRALTREIRLRSGEITTEVARQEAVDDGDLDVRYLLMMGEQNATDESTTPSTEPVVVVEPGDIKKGEPGPDGPPQSAAAGAVPRPGNSNEKRPRNPATNQKRTPGGTSEGGARA